VIADAAYPVGSHRVAPRAVGLTCEDLMTDKPTRMSREELAGEAGSALPPKEVLSLLDLNVDADVALDLAAPIDLAVAANANVAAPIDAAASANILSALSSAQSLADQDAQITQGISGEANAEALQTSALDQSDDTIEEPSDVVVPPLPTDPADALSGGLLDVNVDLALDADIAAPIAGAVAANANVAAPIDAAVAANIGSIGSEATAVAQQDAIITQDIDADATATADQQSDIRQ
jgi:hypothetical protein